MILSRASGMATMATAVVWAGIGVTVQAGILEDFQFSDSNGTLLAAAANSVNPANLWSEDAVDMPPSSVQSGAYLLNKANDAFGTNYLQIGNITSGKAWLVAEIASWSFSSLIGPSEFDSTQLEEVRFSFLNNDTGTSGSTNTAAFEIQRNLGGGIELVGTSGGTGGSIAAQSLSLNQTNPFTVVLELDKDSNLYSVYSKVGAGSFNLLGSAAVDPLRDGKSIRFVANNSFSGTGESFRLDRVYLTDINPIPEPASLALFAIGALAMCRKPKVRR